MNTNENCCNCKLLSRLCTKWLIYAILSVFYVEERKMAKYRRMHFYLFKICFKIQSFCHFFIFMKPFYMNKISFKYCNVIFIILSPLPNQAISEDWADSFMSMKLLVRQPDLNVLQVKLKFFCVDSTPLHKILTLFPSTSSDSEKPCLK